MNVSRFVSFGSAVLISALQWTAVLGPALPIQSVRTMGVPVAVHAPEESLPEVIITAHRES